MQFFDNYEPALGFCAFTADRMYYIDERGESTFVQSPDIVAQLGTKQVDKLSEVNEEQ
jgi:hypothetical protein